MKRVTRGGYTVAGGSGQLPGVLSGVGHGYWGSEMASVPSLSINVAADVIGQPLIVKPPPVSEVPASPNIPLTKYVLRGTIFLRAQLLA